MNFLKVFKIKNERKKKVTMEVNLTTKVVQLKKYLIFISLHKDREIDNTSNKY